jgi:phosphatidylglycerophosphate synthase
VDRFYLLAPAILIIATLLVGFAVYSWLCRTGRAPQVGDVKHNQLFNKQLAGALAWMLGPLERALVGRVSPNAVTALSLGFCALTGVAIAMGDLARASWLIAIAGFLDVLDGRIARGAKRQTAAGALFDSVSDRWGELFVFAGLAWLVRDSAWLLAVIAAYGGSMMVSYTRARSEALGVSMTIGIMQRAERVVLIAFGMFTAAWFGDPDVALPILGGTLLACGILSTSTAINRWWQAYRILAAREIPVEVEAPIVPLKSRAPLAEVRGPKSEVPAQSAKVATTGA